MARNIQSIELKNIESSYAGAAGKCCCGCSGKHYCTQHGFASRSPSYQSYSKVNEAQVERVLSIIKAADPTEVKDDGGNISTTIGNRLYVIYLMDA